MITYILITNPLLPLLQLFLALGERCTDDATERARNGERDRDRGRPVLLVRSVRVVAVRARFLQF